MIKFCLGEKLLKNSFVLRHNKLASAKIIQDIPELSSVTINEVRSSLGFVSNLPENMACNIEPGINTTTETVLSQIIDSILLDDTDNVQNMPGSLVSVSRLVEKRWPPTLSFTNFEK